MPTRTDPTGYELDSWDDLEDHLRTTSHLLTAVVGRDGPVVTLAVGGRAGALRLTDPRDRLRADDRRRLHRLGLRPERHTDSRCWTWTATAPKLPLGARTDEQVRQRLQAWTDLDDSCRAQLVAVLRDGLRLDPSSLTVLPRHEDDGDR